MLWDMREQPVLRLARPAIAGLLLALGGTLGACASANPARDNYYSARNTVLTANAGDGSLAVLRADRQTHLETRFADARDTSGR